MVVQRVFWTGDVDEAAFGGGGLGGSGGEKGEEGKERMCAHDDERLYMKDAVPGTKSMGDWDILKSMHFEVSGREKVKSSEHRDGVFTEKIRKVRRKPNDGKEYEG